MWRKLGIDKRHAIMVYSGQVGLVVHNWPLERTFIGTTKCLGLTTILTLATPRLAGGFAVYLPHPSHQPLQR